MIYKLKHLPTGLYYQPHRHRGSHLSKKGKIYQTNSHGLSSAFKYADIYNDINSKIFVVYCEKDSQIYKQTKEILIWSDCRSSRSQLRANTYLKDWVIENLEKI